MAVSGIQTPAHATVKVEILVSCSAWLVVEIGILNGWIVVTTLRLAVAGLSFQMTDLITNPI